MKQPLYTLIAENFSADELRGLGATLQVVYEDLPGSTKTLKVMGLQEHMSRRGRLGELLAELHSLRPRLNLSPYLHLVIAEQFSGEEQMTWLLQRFGLTVRDFGGPEKFAWGSEPWRAQKAEALQQYAEEESLVAGLLGLLQERDSHLDLHFYTDVQRSLVEMATIKDTLRRRESLMPDAPRTSIYANFGRC